MLNHINKFLLIKQSLLFLLLLFFTQNILFGNTSTIVIVDKEVTKIDLYEHIEILEDKTNKLTIEDVKNDIYNDNFKPTSLVGNAFGFSKSAFWVRFSLKIDKDVKEAIYLELDFPLMDYANLYIPDQEGGFIENKSGEFVSYSQKDVNYRNHVFNIPTTSQKVETYYMYVKSGASTQIPLKLYTSNTLIEQIDKTNFLLGGYYGNMFLLMLATFLAFYKIRDKLFLTYGIYLLTYLFFQLSINGFFVQYFSPFALEYSNKLTSLSVTFVVFGALLFSGNYLQIWQDKHKIVKLLFYTIASIALVGSLVTLFIDASIGVRISSLSGIVLPLIILIGAISSLKQGYKPAKYFLFAWAVFLFGIFVLGLLFFGLVPHTFVTAYSMQIGSTLELFLLSYALIYRINLVYEEKEEAKQKADEYLNQINEGLESLVEERTRELNHKNELLSNLAIRDSMTNMLNHNASIEALESMKSTALRHGYNLAVIMMDIDLFKSINDTYGHPAGDQVIIQIAEIVNRHIRPSDIAGRYGGEEFIIILHNANETNAVELAERMRIGIASLKIAAINNQPVSASFGISVLNHSYPNRDIIQQADKALYEAKNTGRNNIKNYSA